MGSNFLDPGPPKFPFVESKGCQFLFILFIGQDGVIQKVLTLPISLMNVFLGHPAGPNNNIFILECMNLFITVYCLFIKRESTIWVEQFAIVKPKA